MRKRIFWIFFWGLFFYPVSVYAQIPPKGSTSLQISPPTFELGAGAGRSLSNTVRVLNPTDKPISVAAVVKDFIATGEDGSVNLVEEDKTTYSLASWVSVEPASAVIPAKAAIPFTFTINIPKGAEPGGHFGSIVFSTEDKNEEIKGSGAKLTTEVGALVLLNIAGKAKESAKLVSFEPVKKFFEFGPVGLEYRIQNKGNVHVKPSGRIVIKNMLNQVVFEDNIDPKNVLPNAIRKSVYLWNHKWLLGKYRAQISLKYGQDSKILNQETQFWGFPYKLFLAGSLVAFLLVFGLARGRRRLKKATRALFGHE